MLPYPFAAGLKSPTSLSLFAMIAISLSGCMSSAEQRHVNLQEDMDTCESFGSGHGSRAYSNCMLAQQRRRDVKERESLEKTRITSELAINGQIMAERARRDRCRRNPDRRECGR